MLIRIRPKKMQLGYHKRKPSIGNSFEILYMHGWLLVSHVSFSGKIFSQSLADNDCFCAAVKVGSNSLPILFLMCSCRLLLS